MIATGCWSAAERGAAIIPGKPDESLLVKAVSRVGDLKMPPGRRLSDHDIAILKRWIRDGADWTKVGPVSSDSRIKADYQSLLKEHWAWRPLRQPPVPAVKDSAWPREEIDRFLLARMEQKGLRPVADAEKLHLIRRATFDLTGLPPTLAEIDAFLADHSERAFELVVDRLLASPAFGERWGRHWLDVARYGESTGSARNLPYPHAWRYRDYVINAFNNDKPYDQFLREQIAGDLLSDASSAGTRRAPDRDRVPGARREGRQPALQGALHHGQHRRADRHGHALDPGPDGGCARCHDHKFDPIPTTDYYALAGIFHSTDLCAGLRNKMGGGGLDYYDPTCSCASGTDAPPTDASAEKTERLQQELARPGGISTHCRKAAESGRDGQPKPRRARQKVNRLQAELASTERPGGQRSGRPGRSRRQDGRRHRHPHPRRGRKTRAGRSARLPQRCAVSRLSRRSTSGRAAGSSWRSGSPARGIRSSRGLWSIAFGTTCSAAAW